MLCGFTCLFSSCSDDDDGAGSSSELIGTWQAKSSTGYEIYNGKKYSFDDTYEGDEGDYITFKSDGTFETYNIDGGKRYDDDEGKWKLSGNQLSLYYYSEDELDEIEVTTIESITSTQLVTVSHEKDDDYEYYCRDVLQRVK